MTAEPAARPCPSCPYRADCPSGLWAPHEYALLPLFDLPTYQQPIGVFYCHQATGRLCAGWAAVHDMDENLGLRAVSAAGLLTAAEVTAVRAYRTDVPLHPSGAAAAWHGMRDLTAPSPEAVQAIAKIVRRRARTGRPIGL